eukprot:GHVQ01036405.1.p1 GENE.GHVQ01036405.1~~GHVQ01036405.1.p1  ORF type:complete len:316 (-),score=39.91 GHVQ01036405.1:1297-2244(-)
MAPLYYSSITPILLILIFAIICPLPSVAPPSRSSSGFKHDGYSCSANRPEFPDRAFSKQPDDTKVYLRLDATTSGTSVYEAGLSKFVSVFGIRVVGDSGVSDTKLLYVATTLAELLDVQEKGTPTNNHLVEALRNGNSMIVIVSNGTRFRQLSRRQYRPKELKCFPRAFHLAHESVVKLDKSREINCPSDEGKKDRTRGLVGDYLVSKGFPATYPVDHQIGRSMKDFYDTAKANKWINTDSSNCRSDVCLEIAFQSWALSSALKSDKCWCTAAGEWKFCTPEDMKSGFPALWGTLATELKNVDGQYRVPGTVVTA